MRNIFSRQNSCGEKTNLTQLRPNQNTNSYTVFDRYVERLCLQYLGDVCTDTIIQKRMPTHVVLK